MGEEIVRRVRSLYEWEIGEARLIFGDTLKYDRVRVHEGVSWPDFANTIGRRLKKLSPPGPGDHNAITLGNNCYFPLNLPETLPPIGDMKEFYIDWLIHEMTHAWQYQHTGPFYLLRAVYAQFREGDGAYNYGGIAGLDERRRQGKTLSSLNPEQQGRLTQDYYVRQRAKGDVTAFLPYIQDIQQTK